MIGPGAHWVQTPQFRSLDIDADLWMRITLSDALAVATARDGSGPATGYEFGETEDFLLLNTVEDYYQPAY